MPSPITVKRCSLIRAALHACTQEYMADLHARLIAPEIAMPIPASTPASLHLPPPAPTAQARQARLNPTRHKTPATAAQRQAWLKALDEMMVTFSPLSPEYKTWRAGYATTIIHAHAIYLLDGTQVARLSPRLDQDARVALYQAIADWAATYAPDGILRTADADAETPDNWL